MVGRALSKSLAPLQKKEQDVAERQAQISKELNMIRENQVKQTRHDETDC